MNLVRLSFEGDACIYCGGVVLHMRCQGCGWIDPPTTRPVPQGTTDERSTA